MSGRSLELTTEAAAWERRAFIAAVGVLNLAFLALDAASGYPHPGAVAGSRIALSALLFWLAVRLGRPSPAARLRPTLAAVSALLSAAFGWLGWATGGMHGPYLAFLPLLPLVITVGLPDEPLVPIASGATALASVAALDLADGGPSRTVLWTLACASTTFYGWMGTFLFRRMRLREQDALLRQAEALRAAEEALARSRRDAAERRAMEQRVAVSARLAAMGTLVAGLSHEMNNPLGGAMASHGFALEEVDALREELASDRPVDRKDLADRLSEVFEALQDGQASERRLAGILKDLSLLGVDRIRGDRLSLPAVVTGALRWRPSAVAQRAKVSVEDRGSPEVLGSEGQLAQVIVNLVTNAAKAVPEGGVPEVRIRIDTAGGGAALLEVSDNGAGMGPETLARIFDPFFTTRAAGQGMGLGLPICHAIVTAHGGTIGASSAPGQGSTFRIELPAAGQGPQSPN